jgi:ectoine hydroxylase-related dioxygenase (phytanoyl-CoA dioxygenase family)
MMTDTQRLFFETNGYLTIPGALAPDVLARVQAEAVDAEKTWRSDTTRPGARSEVLHQVQSPIEYGDALLHLLWNPTIFPLVREILGNQIAMIDNDLFLTPPHTPHTHAGWHHDVGMPGVYHPRSTLMVKVFYLLTDVHENSGGTAVLPGSHRYPMDFTLPQAQNPREMPGAVQMLGKAGDAYLFHCRIYHCAVNNESDHWRRVLIYNYGHAWMKIWPGYEPSARLQAWATAQGNAVQKQLLGMAPAYVSSLSESDA